MKENDIRPAFLKDQHLVAIRKDISRLLARYDEFVEVPCPACFGTYSSIAFFKNGFRYLRCKCQMVYMSPRPSPDLISWFYRGSENYRFWSEFIYPESAAGRFRHIILPRVERVLQLCGEHSVSHGRLLEIGCADGSFCREMLDRGTWLDVVGVELTPDLAEQARKRGVRVIESKLEELAVDDISEFDLIVAFEVIEHLFSPAESLAVLVDVLKPGGMLVVTCPNVMGFEIDVLGEKSVAVDHEHLNYFSPDSLSLLLEDIGLTVVKAITPGTLDVELVRNAVLSGDVSLDDNVFLQRILLGKDDEMGASFQKFLSEAKMSSHMWLAAVKR